MAFVVAAVVLVGVLCVLNMLLTFTVLRRLREHTAELARLAAGPALGGGYDPARLVGQTFPDLEPERPELVGVFDAQCSGCHKHAPEFATAVRGRAALAVVTGTGPEAEALVGLLREVPRVLVGEEAGGLAYILGVTGFPTYLRVGGDGTIVWAGSGSPEGMTESLPV